MKVTLENFTEFDLEKMGKPDSFKAVVEQTDIKNSFKDIPAEGMKEIGDMNEISFGHFIVLEKILALDMESNEKIKLLAPYILRPSQEGTLDNDNEEKELQHQKNVNSLQIGSVLAAFNRFIEKRNNYLFKQYNGVIYATITEGEEDDDEDEDSKAVNSALSAREFHNKKFFWYSLVGTVCNNDIFKRQDAVELPMSQVMPFLAEKRSLAIIENLERKIR